MGPTLSLENDLFRSYLFYSSILILKMMFMSGITGLTRIKHKIYVNKEDAAAFRVKLCTDERVERPRRAHLNDLENIPLFFVAAPLYLLTNPAVFVAKTLFLAYTAARIGHTVVYALVPVPQPARGLCWAIGYGITGYMAVTTLLHFK